MPAGARNRLVRRRGLPPRSRLLAGLMTSADALAMAERPGPLSRPGNMRREDRGPERPPQNTEGDAA